MNRFKQKKVLNKFKSINKIKIYFLIMKKILKLQKRKALLVYKIKNLVSIKFKKIKN